MTPDQHQLLLYYRAEVTHEFTLLTSPIAFFLFRLCAGTFVVVKAAVGF